MQPSVKTKPIKAYSYLGFLLLAAYLVQDFFNLKWAWLVTLQTGETFKQLTGLLLLSYLAHQWYLSRLRLKGRAEAARAKLSQHLGGAGAAGLLRTFAQPRACLSLALEQRVPEQLSGGVAQSRGREDTPQVVPDRLDARACLVSRRAFDPGQLPRLHRVLLPIAGHGTRDVRPAQAYCSPVYG